MPNVHPAIINPAHEAALRWVTHNYWIDEHHWLHGPNVVTMPIPEATTQAIIHPYNSIIHTNGNPGKITGYNAYEFYRKEVNKGECHIQVDGVDLPAKLFQYMPFNRRADNNYKANSFYIPGTQTLGGAISFECQDRGSATVDVTPLSVGQHSQAPEIWGQHDSIVSALICISVCYGVWCTVPTAWNDSGIGHHILYPEWYATARSCPGKARIRQMDSIRAGVAAGLAQYADMIGGWKCGTGLPR